jgi:uncharacterized protein
MEAALEIKERKLIESLAGLDSVIVAYSGGVDSSLLSYYARRTLGANAKVVIAVSPSLAAEELAAARAQARSFQWDLIEISTDEVDSPDYQRNDLMRCYFCKKTLFEELTQMVEELGIRYIAYGANLDDSRDFRPGHKAAREYHVLSPLQDAGLSKEEIRELARNAGLPSWNRPQAACLSSRFQTFEPISVELLSRVDKAERLLHSLGFQQVRVRHHGDFARIELDKEELPRFQSDSETMKKVAAELKQLGYRNIFLDLDGYRQGSANIMNSEDQKQQWIAID